MSLLTRIRYSLRWLRRLLVLWRDPNRRFLAFPPGHFASPLPDHAEIEREHPALVQVKQIPGLDLQPEQQQELLKTLGTLCREMPFPKQTTAGFRYHYENEFFTYGDAHYLFGMIRQFRPRRIIEVGSGFSSALMLDTRERFAEKPELTFIEPYPTRLTAIFSPGDRANCTLIEKRVQEVPLEVFRKLEANDILFIDSSHVSKIGSDVNYLFFEVLPQLRPGVLIHIHDIFWPFEYPKTWYDLGWAWNEVYLLRAMLVGSQRYRIVAFPSYLESEHRASVEVSLPSSLLRAEATPATGASSIWLIVDPETRG